MTPRAILFDYGGTLDGPARHWLDRFLNLYRAAGFEVSFERFRVAFGHATQCGYAEPRAAAMDLQALVEFHVARQMEQLGIHDPELAQRVVGPFVRASRAALADSRRVLERLRSRAVLGVISNFYGNVDRLLAEAGIAPLLGTIIDSARVGVRKPSPEIFALAVRALGCPPGEALYVGDSFEKDIVGARAAGLRTAWLVGPTERPCRAPELVDLRLRSLADLETALA